MCAYYDGTKLLSLLDLKNKKPEIYLCTTNRTGGKTTFFGRLCINKFIKNNSKFMLLYRFKYQTSDLGGSFYKDIGSLFFQGHEFSTKNRNKGVYQELFFDGVSCGYATSLSAADAIKNVSHMFSDVDRILMDEFQSETNHYASNEVQNLISIHTSVARGQYKQVRYVPVYMCANAVTLLNPYYAALGISSRLSTETKFLRGNGYVLEQGYVETASRAQRESAFNQAFCKTQKYVDYASENVYLNDSTAFIEKPKGAGKYVVTLRYKNKHFAIREFINQGVIYCDNRPDMSFPYKLAVTTDDHAINYVMLKNNDILVSSMRFFFERGAFRFRDLECKEAIFAMLSYY